MKRLFAGSCLAPVGLALGLVIGTAAEAQAPAPAAPLPISIGSRFAEGQCLETRADATIIIDRCNAQPVQLLSYDDETGQFHQGDQCLAAVGRGQPLAMVTCGDGDEQKWTFMADETLRSDSGLCADILNFQKAAGTAVIAWDCNATDNQKFFATNVKVVAAVAPKADAPVAPVITGQPVIASYFTQGKCFEASSRSTLTVETCNMKPAQTFHFRQGASGQIVQVDKCLASANKGEPLVVTACTNGTEQDWMFAAEGTLRNRAGLCADLLAFQSRAGTPVIAWDCTATDNQKVYPAIAAASGSFSYGDKLAKQLTAAGKPTTVSMVAGYSAYNLTASGGRGLSANSEGRVIGGQDDTIVVGGAGVLTVRFVNGLAAPGIKAELAPSTDILPKDWSFFSGTTAGRMVAQ